MLRTLSALPYVEAANWSREIGPQPKWWVVIHCMEYPEKLNSAEWCAAFFAGREGTAPRSSAHACIDADSIVQCVPWDRVAWHAPGANQYGIGLEHAGYARQGAADWSDAYSIRMLDKSAWLTAELCRKFAIPTDFIDAAGLLAGERGITTHAECTLAWKKSTHTDPGANFPMGEYLRSVATYSGGAPGA